MKTLLLSIVVTGLLAFSACNPSPAQPVSPTDDTLLAETQPAVPAVDGISLSSPAFTDGTSIPDIYTCKGADTSPALAWDEPPAGTKSFALIMDDIDAPSGVFNHWVIYNIPGASRGLPETVPNDAQLADGSLQGLNSADQTGYAGPCPPTGSHRYAFKLYVLDVNLDVPSGATKDTVLGAMQGHILAQGQLTGSFKK